MTWHCRFAYNRPSEEYPKRSSQPTDSIFSGLLAWSDMCDDMIVNTELQRQNNSSRQKSHKDNSLCEVMLHCHVAHDRPSKDHPKTYLFRCYSHRPLNGPFWRGHFPPWRGAQNSPLALMGRFPPQWVVSLLDGPFPRENSLENSPSRKGALRGS